MTKAVPTYSLDRVAQSAQDPDPLVQDVFVLDARVKRLKQTFGLPYRTSYYGVGLCFRGSATVSADLETHQIRPRSVLAMSPQTIKQWRHMSNDFKQIVLFFTKAFLTRRNALDPDRFSFFDSGRQMITLCEPQAKLIQAELLEVQRAHTRTHRYREDILRAKISALLYQLQALSEEKPLDNPLESRGQHLTRKFKRLVKRHSVAERSVAFYARTLSITPRHLSATVSRHTGRTAGQWIQETLVLEARVLLQDAALTVAQVAEHLHFSDQSTFGKYFKHVVGLSPQAYRKESPTNPTF